MVKASAVARTTCADGDAPALLASSSRRFASRVADSKLSFCLHTSMNCIAPSQHRSSSSSEKGTHLAVDEQKDLRRILLLVRPALALAHDRLAPGFEALPRLERRHSVGSRRVLVGVATPSDMLRAGISFALDGEGSERTSSCPRRQKTIKSFPPRERGTVRNPAMSRTPPAKSISG